MKRSELKEIIREELLKESSIKDYMNSPNDSPTRGNNYIRLTLIRNPDAQRAWYRLETDSWFRRYFNPGKGYGLMIRAIRIVDKPKYDSGDVIYKFTCKYLPNGFDDPDDDTKENWEHAYGLIVFDRKVHEIFVEESSIKELESFIKNNIRKYKP